MNEALFDLFNEQAGRMPWLDAAARFFANDGVFVLAAVLAGLGVASLIRERRLGLRAATAAGLGLLLTGGLVLLSGLFVFEQRPFVSDPDTVLLISHSADNAFPSDHAAVAAAITAVGVLAWPRWTGAFVVLLVLATVSRVFVGVHLPGDVLAGWIGGGLAGAAAWYATTPLAGNRPVELVPSPDSRA